MCCKFIKYNIVTRECEGGEGGRGWVDEHLMLIFVVEHIIRLNRSVDALPICTPMSCFLSQRKRVVHVVVWLGSYVPPAVNLCFLLLCYSVNLSVPKRTCDFVLHQFYTGKS